MEEKAVTLLETIWRGIPADYKSRYRMTIWQQFEDQIRSAAYTDNLGKFVNSLCYKLNATIGRNQAEREQAMSVLSSTADARPLLKLMREQTSLLVLMVRMRVQESRGAWLADHPDEWEEFEDEGDEDAEDELPLFAAEGE